MGRNEDIATEASRWIPGGVSSNLRDIGYPFVVERTHGARLVDADGREYVDYHAAFGAILLGHRAEAVDRRVAEAMARVDLAGVGTMDLEARLAERIVHHVPCAEKLVFVSTGSEATYHAIRLARAATGRSKIIKFQGAFHGWHDYVALNVASPADRIGTKDPLSAGILPAALDNTLVLPFNDVQAAKEAFANHGDEIAGVIVEPILHNVGCIPGTKAFLQNLRDLCTAHSAALIFDEVITGFRHALGGYQSIIGVTPDLTTLAKGMANGYPIAALCGRADLMEMFATGDVLIAGTYNAHPATLAAALATIERLEQADAYTYLYRLGDRMRDGLRKLISELELPAQVSGFGSVFVVYFLEDAVERYEDLLANDEDAYVAFHRGMIEAGFFMLPHNLKRNHLTLSHTEADVDATLEAAAEVLARLTPRVTRFSTKAGTPLHHT